MNTYFIIPIAALLFNGAVWSYIFINRKERPVNNSFLLYSTNLTLWIINEIILRQPLPVEYIMPLIKINSIMSLAPTFWFLNFTYTFIGRKKDLVYYISSTSVFTTVLISLTTNLILADYIKTVWGYDRIAGVLYFPAIIVAIILPAIYSVYLIIVKIKTTSDYTYKKSLSLILIGSLISLVLGLVSNVIIPHVFNNHDLVQVGESTTVVQSCFILIAVIKYRLFTPGVEDVAHDLFANMKEAVLILDKEGRILQLNAYAERLFGSGLTNKEEVVYVNNLFYNYEINKDFADYETDYLSDGEKKILSLSQMGIIHKDDIELGRLLIARDITERKRAEEALRESEEKFRWLFDNVPDGIYLSTPEGKLVNVNEALVKLFGYNSKEELLATDIVNELYMNPSERKFWIQKLEVNGKLHSIELHLKRKDGSPLMVRENAHLLADKHGILYYEGTLTDITELKEAEKALRSSEIRFRSVWENSAEGIRLADKNGIIIAVNKAFCNLVEMKAQDLVEQPITVTYRGGKNKESMLQNYQMRFNERNFPLHLEQRIVLPSGKTVYLDGTNTFVDVEHGNSLLLSVFRDVTEKRLNEEKLRALSASLETAREEERSYIARELHDELGQVLTAIKMDLTLMQDDLRVNPNLSKEEITKQLVQIEKMVDRLINTVRNIATELRPDVLDHLGLIAALEWQAKEFEKRYKVRCVFNSNIKKVELGKEKATGVFRIFQESLTNVARHSGASQVMAKIQLLGDKLLLEVEDNGKGISREQLFNITSIGIIGMKERAKFIGGKVFIEGPEGKGTKVFLEIPLSPADNIK